MASQGDSEKRSRLIDQVEVEVIRDPLPAGGHDPAPATYEANPLRALEEIVARLERLEESMNVEPDGQNSAHESSCEAILSMQRHLEQFQRQSSVLKRLLMKLH